VKLRSFLISELDGVELWSSCYGSFNPESLWTWWRRGNQIPDVHSVASHSIEWSTRRSPCHAYEYIWMETYRLNRHTPNRLYIKPKHLFFLLLTNQGLLSCVLYVFAHKREVAAFGSVGGQTLDPRWARNIRIPSAVHALCTCCRVETSFVRQETHKRFTARDRCSCNLSVPLHAMEYKSSCNH
jgi:hypothetical protein